MIKLFFDDDYYLLQSANNKIIIGLITLNKSSLKGIMQKQLKVQNNQTKSILYSNSHLTYIQLAELQKTISDLVQQNRKKHAKIVI